MDKGPWGVWPVTAWDSAAGRNIITDYEVWSDDFEHDVKLRVLGDFSDLGPQRHGEIPMSERDSLASKIARFVAAEMFGVRMELTAIPRPGSAIYECCECGYRWQHGEAHMTGCGIGEARRLAKEVSRG